MLFFSSDFGFSKEESIHVCFGSLILSLIALLLFFLIVFGECGDLFSDCGLELAQTFVLAGEDSLFPDQDLVKLAVSHKNLVQSSQVLIVSVHDSEHPESIVLNRLDRITIQSQTLQVLEPIELLGLI